MSFPISLSKSEDSRFFKTTYEDPALRSEMDGGYEITRARHSRTPRRNFTTGFTDLTDADRLALESFFRNTTKGGSVAFNYTHPISSEVISVRFTKPFTFNYAGLGETYHWNVSDIEMREV